MRLKILTSNVEPDLYQMPTECPQKGCHGVTFKQHQDKCPKGMRDPQHEQVEVRRYRCLRCGHPFRVYPKGVTRAQQSNALKALSVLLYLLGLSYGAVSDALEAMVAFRCTEPLSVRLKQNPASQGGVWSDITRQLARVGGMM